MKTLDQKRAQTALEFWERVRGVEGADGGKVLNGLPALIMNDGLLATIAFGEEKGLGYEIVLLEVGRYLHSFAILGQPVTDLRGFARQLCDGSSHRLQRATLEALEFIQYLKRFEPGEREN